MASARRPCSPTGLGTPPRERGVVFERGPAGLSVTLPPGSAGGLSDPAVLSALSRAADILLCVADRATEGEFAGALLDVASSMVFLVDDLAEPFPYAHLTG